MRRILVPTDYSSVADKAVEFAIGMSRSTTNELIFFHAGKSGTEELRKKITALAGTDDLATHHARFIVSDLDFDADVVNKLVKEYKIDMVVMGTRGDKTPLTPQVFGSNASAVIDKCEVPVIVVPPNHIYSGISQIAYATDFINFRKELGQVIEFAKTVNAAINVFHVAPVYPDLGTEKTNALKIVEEAKQKHGFSYITYHLEEMERDNQVVKGMHQFVEEHPSDLLVIFHQDRIWIDKIINPSAAVREVIHVKLPILVFRKKV
jgi:nucleotide-binding universal stress UspA family protein